MPWQNDREARRRSEAVYGTAEYKRKRLACMRRARWRCEIRLEGCQGAASEADHVDQVANDPRHDRLRAACKNCHRKVTAQQGGGFRSASGGRDPEPQQRTAW